METPLAARIDALLPQTQCTRCGYPTCRAYADAIAAGETDINHCPPGGADGVAALAALLGRAPEPLDPANGVEAPPLVAVIDEAICIGCTKCIQACPVDAIVGAAKRMHTIIAAECTGCELCLPPCPVDCIALVEIGEEPLARERVMRRATHARTRFDARNVRLARERAARDSRRAQAQRETRPPITRSAVLDAIARGKARREALKGTRR
ncbi:MAG TPA: RnfABCDGE type electron transport complex subunit B [Rhodanobacteraceae bacterium]|nr:RnfABCDGE type electron transport complex subunit B [Rhodanobacteraceae bacterium]